MSDTFLHPSQVTMLAEWFTAQIELSRDTLKREVNGLIDREHDSLFNDLKNKLVEMTGLGGQRSEYGGGAGGHEQMLNPSDQAQSANAQLATFNLQPSTSSLNIAPFNSDSLPLHPIDHQLTPPGTFPLLTDIKQEFEVEHEMALPNMQGNAPTQGYEQQEHDEYEEEEAQDAYQDHFEPEIKHEIHDDHMEEIGEDVEDGLAGQVVNNNPDVTNATANGPVRWAMCGIKHWIEDDHMEAIVEDEEDGGGDAGQVDDNNPNVTNATDNATVPLALVQEIKQEIEDDLMKPTEEDEEDGDEEASQVEDHNPDVTNATDNVTVPLALVEQIKEEIADLMEATEEDEEDGDEEADQVTDHNLNVTNATDTQELALVEEIDEEVDYEPSGEIEETEEDGDEETDQMAEDNEDDTEEDSHPLAVPIAKTSHHPIVLFQPNTVVYARKSLKRTHDVANGDVGAGSSRTVMPNPPARPSRRNQRFTTVTLQCPNCVQPIVQLLKDEFDKHMLNKHGIGPIRCLVKDCNQSFPNKFHLDPHLNEFHPDTSQWPCDKCDQKFDTYPLLSVHNTKQHKLGLYQCAYPSCAFTGKWRGVMTSHYGTSHKKTFRCEHPGCTFIVACPSKLKEHQPVHSDVKPFRCKWPNCDHSFKHKRDVIRHIRTQHLKANVDSDGAQHKDPKDYFEVL